MSDQSETSAATIVVDADFLAVRALGPWITEHAPNAHHGPVELAVQELVVNIIEHAYGTDGTPGTAAGRTIEVRLAPTTSPQGVEITTVDRGLPPSVEVSVRPVPGTPQVGGYGMMIVEQLTTSVTHQRVGDTNVWCLTFNAP